MEEDVLATRARRPLDDHRPVRPVGDCPAVLPHPVDDQIVEPRPSRPARLAGIVAGSDDSSQSRVPGHLPSRRGSRGSAGSGSVSTSAQPLQRDTAAGRACPSATGAGSCSRPPAGDASGRKVPGAFRIDMSSCPPVKLDSAHPWTMPALAIARDAVRSTVRALVWPTVRPRRQSDRAYRKAVPRRSDRPGPTVGLDSVAPAGLVARRRAGRTQGRRSPTPCTRSRATLPRRNRALRA